MLLLIGLTPRCMATAVYQTPEDFIRDVFGSGPVTSGKLWIDKALQAEVGSILGHELGVLRLQYWVKTGRTAWILEEIGKEQPITGGFVVNGGKIEQVRVLIFRETRGGEVHYPFFTDQFIGAGLAKNHDLSRHIDGISGATLSVNAMVKLTKLALLFDQQVQSRGSQ